MKMFEMTDSTTVLYNTLRDGNLALKAIATLDLTTTEGIADAGALVENLQSDLAGLDARLKKWKGIQSGIAASIQQLRTLLLQQLQGMQLQEAEHNGVRVKRVKSPEKVDDDFFPEVVDPKFMTQTITLKGVDLDTVHDIVDALKVKGYDVKHDGKLNKADVLAEWRRTGTIPEGVEIIDDNEHIRVF